MTKTLNDIREDIITEFQNIDFTTVVGGDGPTADSEELTADSLDITADDMAGDVVDLQVIYDNQPLIETAEVFARLSLIFGAQNHGGGSVGNGYMEQQGRLWFQVFVNAGEGVGDMHEYAQKFIAHFRNKNVEQYIRFRGADMSSIPLNDGRVGLSVSIPFVAFIAY